VEKNASYTLFATHYFELTALAQEFREVANVHLDAVEHKDRIVFLHAVEEGPASQSYGIQVAQLAGIPPSVVRAARRRLAELERHAAADSPQADLFAALAPAAPEAPQEHPALAALREVDPDALSPRDALDLVYRLSRLPR
jgi:DNA mismatch repair protein MutS